MGFREEVTKQIIKKVTKCCIQRFDWERMNNSLPFMEMSAHDFSLKTKDIEGTFPKIFCFIDLFVFFFIQLFLKKKVHETDS